MDLTQVPDRKLAAIKASLELRAGSDPRAKTLMQKIAEEAKRRGLKNAAPKDELNKRIEEKKMSNKETIQKALERAIELKADPRVIELLKAQLNNDMNNSKTFMEKFSYKGVDCVLKSVRMEPTKVRPEGYTTYEAICEDLGLRSKVADRVGDAKAQLAKQIDESIKDRDNSKENEMNKCNAMKRKILDSTYSNSVKAKALKKVMEQERKENEKTR
jgi:hypothetical protein